MDPQPKERPIWPMLYWGDPFTRKGGARDGMAMLIDLFIVFATALKPQHEPQQFVRTDIPRERRTWLAEILAGGERGVVYMGHANCRICGKELGNADMIGWGFQWPEKAEHYILEHDVWTPDCDRLLAAVRSS